MKHTDPLTDWKQANGGNAGLSALLNKLNPERRITPQAISQWKQVPADRARDVESVTGISRHALRPDVFGAEKVAS